MQALRSTATVVMRELLSAQPNTPDKLTFAWRIAAGPGMGRAAKIAWTGDGVLRVQARSETWHREIVRGRPVILERLRQLLGPNVVRALVVEARNKT
jgi:hypothetical protein